MQAKKLSRLILLNLLVVALIFGLSFEYELSAEDGLPDGCHIATATEVAAGAPAGFPVCPEDMASGLNNNVGQAKAYLDSLPKRPLSSCAPPVTENIRRLNDTFAVCAAQFLKAYTAQYGTVYITSAFRDGTPGSAGDGSGRSANNCAGGASGSNHQKGLAMDVNPENQNLYPTMWQFAASNPQFGVCFPYLGGDRPHMALAGTGTGEAGKCAAQGVTRPCDGRDFDPNSIQPVDTSPTLTPGLLERAREWFGLNSPQQSPQQEDMCTLPDGLTVPCSAIMNPGGSNPPGDPGGAPSQPLPAQQQPFQNTPQSSPSGQPGSSGGSSGSGASLPSPTEAKDPVTLSIFERINSYGSSLRPTTTSATTSPLRLFVSGNETTTIQNATSSSATIATTSLAGNSFRLQPLSTEQTFTSPDLRGNFAPPYSPPPITGYQKVLSDLRTTLERYLEYLRPFGRPVPKNTDGYY